MIQQATNIIKKAQHVTAFTGAGISVESGIPPFRGEKGLWNKYNPIILDIDYFYNNPLESWIKIKEIFYDFFGSARPNKAHDTLAVMEEAGYLQAIITQNIDNLHQRAGSKNVYEFHGTSQQLICTNCGATYPVKDINLNNLPPRCTRCNTVLKPDFIFFGEAIPERAATKSYLEAEMADVFLVIGTTGQIIPASQIPYLAKDNKATIIEINTQPSAYTNSITDIFLQGKATEMMQKISDKLL